MCKAGSIRCARHLAAEHAKVRKGKEHLLGSQYITLCNFMQQRLASLGTCLAEDSRAMAERRRLNGRNAAMGRHHAIGRVGSERGIVSYT